MQDFEHQSRKAYEPEPGSDPEKGALIPGDPFPWEPDPSPSAAPVKDELGDPSWIDLGGGD